MIFRCENCKNRHDCPENRKQYEKTCDIISAVVRGIDKLADCHSYYSVTVKCDYFCEDKETYIGTTESEGEG